MTFRNLLPVLLVGALLISCGDDNPSSPTDDPPENPNTVSQDIGSDGGEITSSDGKLTLTIPAGALGNTETITIEEISPDELGSEFADIETEAAWELGPDGLEFDMPVTAAYQVEPNDEGNPLEVTMPGLLTETDGTAIALDSLVFEGETLTGTLDHFSALVFERNFATATVRNVPDALEVGHSVMVEVEVRINSGLFGASFATLSNGGEGQVTYIDVNNDPFSSGEMVLLELLTASVDKNGERFDGSFQYTCVEEGEDLYGATIWMDETDENGELFGGTRRILNIPSTLTPDAIPVDCVLPGGQSAPEITEFSAFSTDQREFEFRASINFEGDPDSLSATFDPGDGSGMQEVTLQESSTEENEFFGSIIHQFLEGKSFFEPEFVVEDTETGQSENETIDIQTVTLNVTKDGSGSGTVTGEHFISEFLVIDCGGNCTTMPLAAESPNGAPLIRLIAMPDANSTFEGWSGDIENGEGCETLGDCTVLLDNFQDRTVNATFESKQTSSPDGTIASGVTRPEGFAFIPNVWVSLVFGSDSPFLLAVAGEDGVAILDPITEEVLAVFPLPEGTTGGNFGVTLLEPLEDINGNTQHWMLLFGSEGWYIQEIMVDANGNPQPGEIRPPEVDGGPFQGTTTSAIGFDGEDGTDGGSRSVVVVEAENGAIGIERADPSKAGVYDGFIPFSERILETADGDFPGITSAPIAAYAQSKQDGSAGNLLVVTQGAGTQDPGQVYRSFFSGAGGATLEGTVGDDVRSLECQKNPNPAQDKPDAICMSYNFGSGSLSPLQLFEDESVEVMPEFPVNDGPVAGDSRITDDGNVEFLSTGFNDDGIYVGQFDFMGNPVAGAFATAPASCSQPGDIRYNPEDPDEAFASCNGSDTVVKIDLLSIRADF